MPWYTSEAFSIFMFFVPPIAALTALFWIRRKLIWVSIPITVLIDGVVWGAAITGSSHGKIALVFLIPQVIVVILISLFIMWREKRRSNKIALSCEPK